MRKKTNCTYIGGQAVLEGVMMRGKNGMATACRDESGEIQIEAERINSKGKSNAFLRLPFVRGVVSFVSSLTLGTHILMRSAAVYGGTEEEPSKFEKWFSEKFKMDIMSVISVFSMILGLALAVFLFVFLPYLFTDLISKASGLSSKSVWYNLIEGGFRIVIFVGYILATSLMKDIRRTYMYHGAEHKTISCYEYGMPLTVENVKKCPRVHDRCGTTFLFLVMVISILVFSVANSFIDPLVTMDNSALRFLLRFLLKIALLPIVAGISYEILKLLAKTQSPWVMPLKAPGLSLQLITTREPDDGMIECAIAAFEKVLKMDASLEESESRFAVAGKLSETLTTIESLFEKAGIEGEDAKWIVSIATNTPISQLKEEKVLTQVQAKQIWKYANERLTGRPLWYVIGDTNFCGCTLKVDERVLIPRPETEELVEKALSFIQDNQKVLDLCTGSGAIAIAIKKLCKKNITVTASDISDEALELAKENAKENQVGINFLKSDLLQDISDKFDIVLCNPPYIPTQEVGKLQREVKDYEPKLALDGGEDGLNFYRRLVKELPEKMQSNGQFLLEIEFDQAQDVVKLFENIATCEVYKDLAGKDRIIKGTIL